MSPCKISWVVVRIQSFVIKEIKNKRWLQKCLHGVDCGTKENVACLFLFWTFAFSLFLQHFRAERAVTSILKRNRKPATVMNMSKPCKIILIRTFLSCMIFSFAQNSVKLLLAVFMFTTFRPILITFNESKLYQNDLYSFTIKGIMPYIVCRYW